MGGGAVYNFLNFFPLNFGQIINARYIYLEITGCVIKVEGNAYKISVAFNQTVNYPVCNPI